MKKRIPFSLLVTLMIILAASILSFAANGAPEVSAEVTANSVSLSWEAVDGADGYKVSRVNNDGSLTKLGDVSKTSCRISGMSQNTEYSFVVRPYSNEADGSKSWGEASDIVTVITDKITVSGFSITARTESSFSFSWQKNDAAKGYKIFTKNSDGKYTQVFTTNNNSVTTATVSGLNANTSYTFIIQPYTLNGNKKVYGEKSKEITKMTCLSTVTGLKAVSSTTDKITIAFNAVSGAEKYEIYVKGVSDSAYKLLGTIAKTQINVTGCKAGTRYLFRVKAISSSNASKSCSRLVCATKPTAVTGLKVTKTAVYSVAVSWNKVSDDTSYMLFVKAKGGSWVSKGTTNKTNKTIKGLNGNTNYTIKVVPVVAKSNLNVKGTAATVSTKTAVIPINLTISGSARKGEYIKYTLKNAKFSDINWKFSNSNVKLDSGKLLANGQGSCTITATYGGKSVSKTVTISAPVVKYISGTYDVTNGCYIYQNRIHERCYPGSTTKLITALVALKYCKTSMKMTVGDEISVLPGNASRCGIYRGEKFTLEQLLYGMLLPSGCDAANTIAVNVARKVSGNSSMSTSNALNYFANLMNSYLKLIGCTDFHMANAHGFPNSNHYTTAYNMILVARHVLKNPTLATITSTYTKSITSLSGTTRRFTTTNSTIIPYSQYYYKGACGMKTGTVDTDYCNLICVCKKNGKTVISVVFGDYSIPHRYTSVKTQLDAYCK